MTNATPATHPSPWHPITTEPELKVLGKLGEELNECGSAASRCIIQGVDEAEPVTGKVNRIWLQEEVADVLAHLRLTVDHFGLDESFIAARAERKLQYGRTWLLMLPK